MEKEILISPALYRCKASGLERKGCRVCNKKIAKGEDIVELFSSAYRGNLSYSNRFHLRCFLKTIALVFPEIILDRTIKKEIMIESLGGENE